MHVCECQRQQKKATLLVTRLQSRTQLVLSTLTNASRQTQPCMRVRVQSTTTRESQTQNTRTKALLQKKPRQTNSNTHAHQRVLIGQQVSAVDTPKTHTHTHILIGQPASAVVVKTKANTAHTRTRSPSWVSSSPPRRRRRHRHRATTPLD